MTALLDVNVLIALAWPNHIHHTAAHDFFARQQENGWATCPATQSGFVRISSNPKVFQEARTPAEAIGLLEEITSLEGHVFWPDDVPITDRKLVARERLQGPRQVADAQLLALALRHQGQLATFDREIAALLPAGIDPAEAIHRLSVEPQRSE